jgi:hypothetical protein
MGPYYSAPFPGAEKIVKIHSSGLREISLFDKYGNWLEDRVLLDEDVFGGLKSWRYSQKDRKAILFLVEPESPDTILMGFKEFDSSGRLVKESIFFPSSDARNIRYQYESNGVVRKEIEREEELLLETFNVDSLNRLSEIVSYLISDSISRELVSRISYSYDTDSTYIRSEFSLPNGDIIKERYYAEGRFISDLTNYSNFKQPFEWPDTTILAKATQIDTIFTGDTIAVRCAFGDTEAYFKIKREDGVGRGDVFFSNYLPHSPYEKVTFASYGEGRRSIEGQYRINNNRDTVWAGSVIQRFDLEGRLKNRVVFEGAPKSSKILRDITFSYSDSSVTSVLLFEQKGQKYKNEIIRPSLHSPHIYSIKKMVWMGSQDEWKTYFYEYRKYDTLGNEIYFEDARAQIYRRFDDRNNCIGEDYISKLGELPRRWELEISYE